MSMRTNQRQQQAIVNAAALGNASPLAGVTVHLFSNNVTVQGGFNATLLAAFVECIFPGYAPYILQSPGPAYIAPDQQVHATYPTLPFQATNGALQQMANFVVLTTGVVGMAGSLAVVVTAAAMTGSPVTLAVPVLVTDTEDQIAEKIQIVAQDNADVAAFFTVTIEPLANYVMFTSIAPAANDLTMNVSIANGTATGLTAKPTAIVTRTGQASGTTVNDSVRGYFCTDITNTYLLGAENVPLVVLTTVGQGFPLIPDYVYGG